ncbi:hypothetical protein BC826DRAFT_1027122 [Russula brevipes]|nr:hypothetical protein BC826DRAFT_1027122 [Russula brevipes]
MSHPLSPFDLTSKDSSLLAIEGARWVGTDFARDGKFLAEGCLVACGLVPGRTRAPQKYVGYPLSVLHLPWLLMRQVQCRNSARLTSSHCYIVQFQIDMHRRVSLDSGVWLFYGRERALRPRVCVIVREAGSTQAPSKVFRSACSYLLKFEKASRSTFAWLL